MEAQKKKPKRTALYYEEISWQKAKELLDRGGPHRIPGSDYVNMIAREMSLDEFQDTGQCIALRPDGTVANGIHRLTAAVKAKYDLYVPMMYDTTPEEELYFDTNRKRTFQNTLSQRGKHNVRNLSSALRILVMMAGGLYSKKDLSHREYLEILKRHPNLEISAKICNEKNPRVRNSFVIAIHYIAYFILGERDMATQFVNSLRGEQAYKNDPGWMIFDLATNLKLKGIAINHYNDGAFAWMVMRAWNLFKQHKPDIVNKDKSRQTREEILSLDRNNPEVLIHGWNMDVLQQGKCSEQEQKAA